MMPPSGRLTIDVSGLNSGNQLYDAELLRRIDARRFPTATVDLRECAPSGPGTRYRLAGELTFHGVTRLAEGTVSIDALSDRHLVIAGEQVFDIRDFAISSPTVLMLRIFPDVRVQPPRRGRTRRGGVTELQPMGAPPSAGEVGDAETSCPIPLSPTAFPVEPKVG